ncbi:hypothetical protein D917_06705, partial [Trichinella nativa]
LQGPPQTGQPFKFTVVEACDRIKEEFNFLQAQYHRTVPINRFATLRRKAFFTSDDIAAFLFFTS